MADRPLLLKILRVVSWPYRFPPLSWFAAAFEWLASTWRRFWLTMVTCAVIVVWAAVIANGR